VQYRPELLRESDRYRGRRRAPTPPRSRYAAVITTAFVGAGIVAFGAGAGLHDSKVDSLGSDNAALADAAQQQRDLAANRPGRGEKTLNSSMTQAPEDAWVLPMRGYRFTSPFGQRWGRLHAGIDLGGIREGHPINAVHKGKVIVAGWQGGYGYAVFIQHEDNMVTVYGHNSKLYVKVGDEVKAGDIIAGAGNTGHSYGTHCHLEIRINDVPQDPVKFFKARGVDFHMETEAVFGDTVG
jgi:murein DD-endopeptidase MepM/ murein hydrolase activator NlpD